jgi:hypothetical protein
MQVVAIAGAVTATPVGRESTPSLAKLQLCPQLGQPLWGQQTGGPGFRLQQCVVAGMLVCPQPFFHKPLLQLQLFEN